MRALISVAYKNVAIRHGESHIPQPVGEFYKMIQQVTNLGKKASRIIPLAVMFTVCLQCASYEADDGKRPKSRCITEMMISENPDSLIFIVRGNRPLTHMAIKQVDPIGLLFHFPDTTLQMIKRAYIPPDNEIISSITADEIVKDKTTTSRIRITLKIDCLYELIPNETELQIVFPKTTAFLKAPGPEKNLLAIRTEPVEPTQKSGLAASRLITVTAALLEDNVKVNLETDGAIKDYKSFTMNNPARIVFDLYNIKSPHKIEQTIAVDSKWIKQVRHFGYPDKVRVVIDTDKDYLSKYSILAYDNGLIINVGEIF